MLNRLLDDHTDGETAEQLNAAGRRSGTNKPFTAHIILQIRNAHQLPSHQDRLRAQGLLTIDQTAQRLGVHVSTIKAWHRAGLLTSHKANDRNERLFDPPDPTDPRLKARQGWRLQDREPTPPSRRGAL
jgi:DNA-binding transcriptional regulator YiaG